MKLKRVERLAVLCVAGVALAAALVGCGSSRPRGSGTVVDVGVVASLGSVLTTSAGMTLYIFPPDAERQVTCRGACALSWPPLTVAAGSHPKAGPGVQQSLLGTYPGANGSPAVVTYDGWPLYTYRDDVSPGQASGQGVYLNGGYWWVMSPSGQPQTETPS